LALHVIVTGHWVVEPAGHKDPAERSAARPDLVPSDGRPAQGQRAGCPRTADALDKVLVVQEAARSLGTLDDGEGLVARDVEGHLGSRGRSQLQGQRWGPNEEAVEGIVLRGGSLREEQRLCPQVTPTEDGEEVTRDGLSGCYPFATRRRRAAQREPGNVNNCRNDGHRPACIVLHEDTRGRRLTRAVRLGIDPDGVTADVTRNQPCLLYTSDAADE